MSIRIVISFEYAFGCIVYFLFYVHLDYSIWMFFLLLFVPDITMIGYIVNRSVGALLYNVGHSFIFPYMLLVVAILNEYTSLLMIVIIWLAHIYLDRSIGFGLKYRDSFRETHLQKIT